MNGMTSLLAMRAVWACTVILLAGTPLQAARYGADSTPANHDSPREPAVVDVELDAAGSLHGAVIALEGVPVAHAAVAIRCGGREVKRTRTDALGYFFVKGLRGGTYMVTAGGCQKLYRIWLAQTAPPKTSRLALVIVGGDVVRGQMPLEGFCGCDASIIAAMVGAMVAIPVAVHQSRQNAPTSP